MTYSTVQIIQTKLAPPRISGRPQRREALTANLDARRNKRLTLILGPAGCGKTTFSALWRRDLVTSGAITCWYNLSSEDTDLSQFVAYLISSLKTISESFGTEALKLYNESGGRFIDGFIASLINDFSQVNKPVYLFLEDFHTILNSEPGALLERILELAPPALHLVITSRTRPPLNLAQLRAQDEINELSFSDLQFSLQETCSFLRAQNLNDLSPAQMNHLHLISDGWAAGLQLMVYSLKKSKDPDNYISSLKGALKAEREESLTQYIEKAIDSTLSNEELDFLVYTSACRRFNSELCQLITGNENATKLLEQFEADSLFLIPIDYDDERQWYRFHRTFAKFLNEKLLRKPHSELKRINRIASEWFAQKGLQVEAIRHAIYAGEVDHCVSLVEGNAREMTARAQFLQLLKWFDQLPKERTRGHLKLLLSVAWAQIACDRREDFEWNMQAIQETPESALPEVNFELQLLRALHLIRLDDTAAALHLLEPYLHNPPAKAGRFALYALYLLSSLALVYADEFERVRDLAHYSRTHVFHYLTDTSTPFLDGGVGLSYLLQGDVLQARELLSTSLKQARKSPYLTADPEAYLAGYLAEAHYQLDELDAARTVIANSAPLLDVIGTPDSILFAHRVEVRLHLLHGDLDKAFDVLKKVEDLGARLRIDRVLAWSLKEQVRVQIDRRRSPASREALRRLEQMAERYESVTQCAFSEIPLFARSARADFLMSQRDFQQAIHTLKQLIQEYETRGHMYRTAVLLIRCAGAQFELGEREDGFVSLHKALSIASQYFLLRVFIDNGQALSDPLKTLIQERSITEEQKQFALKMLARMQGVHESQKPTAPSPRTVGTQDNKTNLSVREVEIVELLAKAFSNKSIGRALNISAGTVKWHLKNIYAKMDVASREDAVMKARNHKVIT